MKRGLRVVLFAVVGMSFMMPCQAMRRESVEQEGEVKGKLFEVIQAMGFVQRLRCQARENASFVNKASRCLLGSGTCCSVGGALMMGTSLMCPQKTIVDILLGGMCAAFSYSMFFVYKDAVRLKQSMTRELVQGGDLIAAWKDYHAKLLAAHVSHVSTHEEDGLLACARHDFEALREALVEDGAEEQSFPCLTWPAQESGIESRSQALPVYENMKLLALSSLGRNDV